jgi:spore coat protein A
MLISGPELRSGDGEGWCVIALGLVANWLVGWRMSGVAGETAPRNHFGPIDYYDVTMRQPDIEVLRGLKSRLWTYNGAFTGPTIEARAGRPVIIRQHNKLPDPAAFHLHGGNVPSNSDGVPGDEIQLGANRTYLYPNWQPATTLYYHDHVHHQEAKHTYRGLSGLYVISDQAEERLQLPDGKVRHPAGPLGPSVQSGRHSAGAGPGRHRRRCEPGQRPTVPALEVEQCPYRFRLLNTSSLDGILNLSLSSGDVFHAIGTDGGQLMETRSGAERPAVPVGAGRDGDRLLELPLSSEIELLNSVVQTACRRT